MAIRATAVVGTGPEAVALAWRLARLDVPVLLLDREREAARRTLGDLASRTGPEGARHAGRLRHGGLDDNDGLLPLVDLVFDAAGNAIPWPALAPLLDRQAHAEAVIVSVGRTENGAAGLLQPSRRPRFLRAAALPAAHDDGVAEFVADPGADPLVLARTRDVLDRVLGMPSVLVRDGRGPLGLAIRLRLLHRALVLLAAGRASVEDLEFLTGPVLGRSRAGILLDTDRAGLDLALGLLRDEGIPQDDPGLALLAGLVSGGCTGQAKPGFFTRDGNGAVSVWRPSVARHEPLGAPSLRELEPAFLPRSAEDRIRFLYGGEGRGFALVRDLLHAWIGDCAGLSPRLEGGHEDFDLLARSAGCLRQGPFELWDTCGREAVHRALQASGVSVPDSLRPWIAGAAPALAIRHSGWSQVRASGAPIHEDAGGALFDAGDGVLCLEFRGAGSFFDAQVSLCLHRAVDLASRQAAALVVGRDGGDFMAGSNPAEMLALATGKPENLRAAIQRRQAVMQAVRVSTVPVVLAGEGAFRGPGMEMAVLAASLQHAGGCALAFDEAGAGLLPCGGMLGVLAQRAWEEGEGGPRWLELLRAGFECLVTGRPVGLAEARRLGWLGAGVQSCRGRHRLLAQAKDEALRLHRLGWRPPQENPVFGAAGSEGRAMMEAVVLRLERAGQLSPFRAEGARAMARVLAGGELARGSVVNLTYVMQLEAETHLAMLQRQDAQRHLHALLRPTGRGGES